jgi:hypothetical protein
MTRKNWLPGEFGKRGQTIAWVVFPTPQEGPPVLNQSRVFKRGEHLLAVGLQFQFAGERNKRVDCGESMVDSQNGGPLKKIIGTRYPG